jgi:hypothetical protein
VFNVLKEDFGYNAGGWGAHCEAVSLGYGGVVVSEVVLVRDCFVPASSSEFICLSVMLWCSRFCRMCFVCLMGMLEYMFFMWKDANVEVGVMGVRCSSCIRSVEFFMLKEFGSGASCEILEVKLACRLGRFASSQWGRWAGRSCRVL